MDLDLQSIWLHQSVPPIVSKSLETISEQVFLKITDPDRQTINVTQWCKRDACWKSVQEIEIVLPPAFESVLISKEEAKAAEREAKSDQKLISGAEAQAKVIGYTAGQWAALYNFCAQKKLMSPDELAAIKIARQLPAKLPNPYQSQRLLALLERAESEGFKM